MPMRAPLRANGAVSPGRAFVEQRRSRPRTSLTDSCQVKIVALLCLVGFLGIVAVAFLSPDAPAPPGIPVPAR